MSFDDSLSSLSLYTFDQIFPTRNAFLEYYLGWNSKKLTYTEIALPAFYLVISIGIKPSGGTPLILFTILIYLFFNNELEK